MSRVVKKIEDYLGTEFAKLDWRWFWVLVVAGGTLGTGAWGRLHGLW